MLSEEEKFRVEIIRLAGIAFMAPAGKIFMDLFDLIDSLGIFKFSIFVSYSLLLAFLGLIFIAKAYDIIIESKR